MTLKKVKMSLSRIWIQASRDCRKDTKQNNKRTTKYKADTEELARWKFNTDEEKEIGLD